MVVDDGMLFMNEFSNVGGAPLVVGTGPAQTWPGETAGARQFPPACVGGAPPPPHPPPPPPPIVPLTSSVSAGHVEKLPETDWLAPEMVSCAAHTCGPVPSGIGTPVEFTVKSHCV